MDTIFSAEIIEELKTKFSSDHNVFEVIAQDKDGEDLKFTIIGKTVNKDLLDKILKVYGEIRIYQIKRLTNINIQ
jgi:hypothetical protein